MVIGASGNLGTPLSLEIGKHYEVVSLRSTHGNQILSHGMGVDSLERCLAQLGHQRSPECVVINAQSPLYRSNDPLDICELERVNVELPMIFAEYSQKHLSKLLYTSSGSVYRPSLEPLTETSSRLIDSDDSYVQSKLKMEDSLRNITKDRVIIIRPFYVFGPFQREHSLFYRLIARVRANQVIELSQGVGMHFNPIYSFDSAKIITKIIQECDQGIFNISGNTNTDLRSVLEQIGKILSITPQIAESGGSASYSIADSSRAWQFIEGDRGTSLGRALQLTIGT